MLDTDQFYITGMRCIMMLQSVTGCIYDGGPII